MSKNRRFTSKLFVFLLILTIIGFVWTQSIIASNGDEMAPGEIRGHIALTFDDGPHPVYTPALLDALQERDVRATFFLLGSNIEEHPEVVARMHEEGHLIGNHSFSHRDLTNLSRIGIFRELEITNILIKEITGSRPNIFRPPFGEMDHRVIDVARQLDMSIIFWSVYLQDWLYQDADIVFEGIMAEATDGSMILLHDVWESTVEATIRAIDALTAQGYVFVTLEELFELNAISLEAGIVYDNAYRTDSKDEEIYLVEETYGTENNLTEPREIIGHIALTFDDGPNPIYTPILLDALQERDIPATFFLLGRQVEEHPEIVARIHAEGHLIGNHSFSHRDLKYLSYESIIRELEFTNMFIENITGNRPGLFRPPFGEKDQRVVDIARQLEMSIILWSIYPQDWLHQDANIIFEKIMADAKDGSVIVLNDTWGSTIEATIKAIDALIDKGYAFVTVEELFKLNSITLRAGEIYHSVYYAPENENIAPTVVTAPRNNFTEPKETRGHIALTFDDGPHPIYTPALLDVLRERDARATFFLLGKQVEEHPEIVARMHEEGHLIGNHSFSHRHLPDLNYDCILEDIESTNMLIEEITGASPNLFRPPYGEKDDIVIEIARQLEMSIILWSVHPQDWVHHEIDIPLEFEEIATMVFDHLMNYSKDGSIVLLHDSWMTTIEATVRAMDALIDKGYTFVTVKELFELNDITLEPGEIYYSVYKVPEEVFYNQSQTESF